MSIEVVLDKVREYLTAAGLLERRIKQVETWDGAASNYPDTAAYCAACLIDVNAAAGRAEKAQSHCFLPVRGPDDGADTYVAQAVFAAAGGRGITRLKRPDDVSEEDWQRAVKAAAVKLIDAYRQMERYAPARIYELAGREPPEEARALSEALLHEQIRAALENSGLYPLQVYHELGGGMYLLATRDGALYRLAVTVNPDDSVTLGEPEAVTEVHPPATGRMVVAREANGRYRWAGIGCTALLNRSGEIDSRQLFDDFVANFDGNAVLDFYHQPNTRLGRVEFIAREGVTLIAGGVFDDTPAAQAAAQRLAADPRGWGLSITYRPLGGVELLPVGGLTVPVYNRGILRAVTILPEAAAAAVGTAITGREVARMRTEVKQALVALVGEELADQLERQTDELNARAADPASGLVFRSVSVEQLAELQAQVEALLVMARELTEKLAAATQQQATDSAETRQRLAALEAWQHEQVERAQAELPVAPPAATYRPSAQATTTPVLEPDLSVFDRLNRK